MNDGDKPDDRLDDRIFDFVHDYAPVFIFYSLWLFWIALAIHVSPMPGTMLEWFGVVLAGLLLTMITCLPVTLVVALSLKLFMDCWYALRNGIDEARYH